MSDHSEARPAGGPNPLPHDFDPWRWAGHRHGPPLPVKILAVVAAFWLFHPLGVALLLFFLWRTARGAGGCAVRGGPFRERREEAMRRRGRASSANTAFEERRREALKALDEEAEAFDAFERRRREAEDRAAFERFVADRNVPRSDDRPK